MWITIICKLGTGKLAKAAGVAKNVAKIGGKALGLAAIPLEVANMLNMRKQGKTTAEILGSPFFLVRKNWRSTRPYEDDSS